MKKFALHPGWVRSQSDGDMHYISAAQLAGLYGIHHNEYIIWDPERRETYFGRTWMDYIHLFVKSDGNYRKVK